MDLHYNLKVLEPPGVIYIHTSVHNTECDAACSPFRSWNCSVPSTSFSSSSSHSDWTASLTGTGS